MISHLIEDGRGRGYKAHVHKRNGDKGVVVYTDVLYEQDTLFSFVTNPTVGFEMAINGAFGGTPEVIHNGVDTVAWTGSNINGTKVTFNDTTQPQAGSNNVLVNKPTVGNIWEFDKGSDLTLSSWQALSLYIYVGSGWTAGNSISIYGYDTGTGLTVGQSVLLEDYFNEIEFGVYQKLSIPLTDMNLSAGTIDAIRMEVVAKSGSGIVCYIDTFQVEETSGSTIFSVEAPQGKKYYVDEFRFTYIDALSTTLASNSMHNLSYDKILGLTKLTNGIGFSRIKDGKAVFSAGITCLADSTRGGSMVENVFSDGTNTHITISTKFASPVLLDSRTSDAITVTVNDDLTGLISFTAVAMGKTQDI